MTTSVQPRRFGAALVAICMCALALAPAAYASATSSTDITIQMDDSVIQTGTAENMKVIVPVKIDFAVQEDLSITGPSNNTVKFANNSIVPVHISAIRVENTGTLQLIEKTDSPGKDQLVLSMTPGAGTADDLGAYVGAAAKAPAHATQWNVDANGGSLFLNNLSGKVGQFESFNPTAGTTVGTIHWTIAAGKAV